MGIIHAEIKLVSSDDLALQRRGYIKPEEVRSVEVDALVDTGAYRLSINEHIQRQLDLFEIEKQEFELSGRLKLSLRTEAHRAAP